MLRPSAGFIAQSDIRSETHGIALLTRILTCSQRPLWTTFQKKLTPIPLQILDVEPTAQASSLLREPGDCTYVKNERALRVRCGDGTEIAIRTVRPAGKPAIAAAEWWNGVNRPVIRLGEIGTAS